MLQSEAAEFELSYHSTSGSESARKRSGSYYTPADVAVFFWREYFARNGLNDLKACKQHLRSHRFLEPSAGAGILIFALLHKIASLGASPREIADIDLMVVDVNGKALAFVEAQFAKISELGKIAFKAIQFEEANFLDAEIAPSSRKLVVFANPPFVTNSRNSSRWKNMCADFVDRSLNIAGKEGTLHFILPLSLAFSRDYASLRQLLTREAREVTLANFDNIPDTLFKAGKPEHTNTNKANSQRCSILSVLPATTPSLFSTKLHRWSKHDRDQFLSRSPVYVDVTKYDFDDQFPRPDCQLIVDYLATRRHCLRVGEFLCEGGRYHLYVAGVARNFIAIREGADVGTNQLSFREKDDFYVVLLLITSDIFYSYWRTVGDGFHVTRSTILNFPISPTLLSWLRANLSTAKRVWQLRASVKKAKQNAGREICSYDFSSIVPSIISNAMEQ